MKVNFCPQCGEKVDDAFKFCPNCGLKLPIDETNDEPSMPSKLPPSPVKRSPVKRLSSASATPNEGSCAKRRTMEKQETDTRSPSNRQGSPKGKGIKHVKIEPIPENEILTDNNNTNWVLGTLFTNGDNGVLYEAYRTSATPKKQHFLLKLDAKDGKIYNEQVFLQRAAKKTTVDKWKKSHAYSFLGIPTCIAFGLHKYKQQDYRFLVFPALGKSFQTIINEKKVLLEKTIFQIVYRMVDVLEYIHANEYVHGNITAENIFVNFDDFKEVYLADYYFAFRYCPAGKHVKYQDGSKTPHVGSTEFISMDVHKGAAPSRRSDMESLGYCMLKWLCGSLPWTGITKASDIMEEKDKFKNDIQVTLKQCFKKKRVPELEIYLDHVMCLNYEEAPDYDKLRNTLSAALGKTDPYDAVAV
ncbi:inactive serine/threonine-protein kinase VRK3 isoform X2 [Pelobates fuscus]|uniref:inactive serine/threonine-protein kinase VRK3 isoform X2 n=1 Tax=Pelobates fuscus TaxID=191477 RepID=UPI002FE4A77B